jgi:transposase
MDKTAITRLGRVDWDTVGRIIARVVGDKLDPARLDRLFVIGVDEVSWRRGHQYLTLVSDHAGGSIVWGAEGRDAATLDGFFDELGTERASRIEAVSMDMSPPTKTPCAPPGTPPKRWSATTPFMSSRWTPRPWTRCAGRPGRRDAPARRRQTVQGARWALLKNPTDLTETAGRHPAQAETPRR